MLVLLPVKQLISCSCLTHHDGGQECLNKYVLERLHKCVCACLVIHTIQPVSRIGGNSAIYGILYNVQSHRYTATISLVIHTIQPISGIYSYPGGSVTQPSVTYSTHGYSHTISLVIHSIQPVSVIYPGGNSAIYGSDISTFRKIDFLEGGIVD